MAQRLAAVCLLCAALLRGQLQPKAAVAGYPVHGSRDGVAIGAGYLGRTVFGPNGQNLVVPGHLVIEVAVFPAKGQPATISTGDFTLYLNEKKAGLLAQAPGFVAAALKYDDWTRKPTLVGQVGLGDADVVIGQRRPSPRFPGDNREARTRLPSPPKSETPEQPYRIEQQRPEEIAVECALPEGVATGPAAGYLYFPYSGKLKSVKSVELVYSTPNGSLRLRLM